jgi:hypothetical protein
LSLFLVAQARIEAISFAEGLRVCARAVSAKPNAGISNQDQRDAERKWRLHRRLVLCAFATVTASSPI